MWDKVLNILISAITSCFSWLDRFLDAIPGAWDTIFTLITIVVISRFLLAPVIGNIFDAGSDRVSDASFWAAKKASDTSKKVSDKMEKRYRDKSRTTEGLRRIARKNSR